MAEQRKEESTFPQGAHEHTTTDAAVMYVTGALAARAGLMDPSEIRAMFEAVEASVVINPPELNAVMLMAVANLAATAYARLAEKEGVSPLDLMQADTAFDQAVVDLMVGGDE